MRELQDLFSVTLFVFTDLAHFLHTFQVKSLIFNLEKGGNLHRSLVRGFKFPLVVILVVSLFKFKQICGINTGCFIITRSGVQVALSLRLRMKHLHFLRVGVFLCLPDSCLNPLKPFLF